MADSDYPDHPDFGLVERTPRPPREKPVLTREILGGRRDSCESARPLVRNSDEGVLIGWYLELDASLRAAWDALERIAVGEAALRERLAEAERDKEALGNAYCIVDERAVAAQRDLAAAEKALVEIAVFGHDDGCQVTLARLDCDKQNYEVCPNPTDHEDAGCDCYHGVARRALAASPAKEGE
jgi:hypothetical protein